MVGWGLSYDKSSPNEQREKKKKKTIWPKADELGKKGSAEQPSSLANFDIHHAHELTIARFRQRNSTDQHFRQKQVSSNGNLGRIARRSTLHRKISR